MMMIQVITLHISLWRTCALLQIDCRFQQDVTCSMSCSTCMRKWTSYKPSSGDLVRCIFPPLVLLSNSQTGYLRMAVPPPRSGHNNPRPHRRITPSNGPPSNLHLHGPRPKKPPRTKNASTTPTISPPNPSIPTIKSLLLVLLARFLDPVVPLHVLLLAARSNALGRAPRMGNPPRGLSELESRPR